MDFLRDSYQSTFIATGATTAITGATGVMTKLIRITIGETAASPIKVYDAVSGGAANSNKKAELKASIAEGTYEYGITMSQGLQVVSDGNSKFTVVWSKV
jgi:hypothetical protein